MKVEREGGYDIIMASEMLGILPPREIDEQYKGWIDTISDQKIWDTCDEVIARALKRFEDRGISIFDGQMKLHLARCW